MSYKLLPYGFVMLLLLSDAEANRLVKVSTDDFAPPKLTEEIQHVVHEIDIIPSLKGKTDTLLDVFNCRYIDVTKLEKSFVCEGASDPFLVASAAFQAAATLASMTGVGLPIAQVLGLMSKVLGLWSSSSGSEDQQVDIITALKRVVNQIESFHFERDVAAAESQSLALLDRVAELKQMPDMEKCNDVIAAAWLQADTDASKGMNEILADAKLGVQHSRDVGAMETAMIKDRIAFLDGMQTLWLNVALDRLELLAIASDKLDGCPDMQHWVNILMQQTLLVSEKKRYDSFCATWKEGRITLLDVVADREVDIIVKKIEKSKWSGYEVTSVAAVTTELLKSRKPGRTVLEELMNNEDMAVAVAIVNQLLSDMPNFHVEAKNPKEWTADELLPFTECLANILNTYEEKWGVQKKKTEEQFLLKSIVVILSQLAKVRMAMPGGYGLRMHNLRTVDYVKQANADCIEKHRTSIRRDTCSYAADLTHLVETLDKSRRLGGSQWA